MAENDVQLPDKPESSTDWYWYRQGKKSGQAKEADPEDPRANHFFTLGKLNSEPAANNDAPAPDAKDKTIARLNAIIEHGLSPDLAKLVPPDAEDYDAYITENILPLQERLQAPLTFGTITQPGIQVRQGSVAQRLVEHFDRLNAASPQQALEFYKKHRTVLMPELIRRGNNAART